MNEKQLHGHEAQDDLQEEVAYRQMFPSELRQHADKAIASADIQAMQKILDATRAKLQASLANPGSPSAESNEWSWSYIIKDLETALGIREVE